MKNLLSSGLGIVTLNIQTDGGDISRSLVTIGQYLNPRLYVGLGGFFFTNTYQIILQYPLTDNIEIEAKIGTEGGATLFFTIEFGESTDCPMFTKFSPFKCVMMSRTQTAYD